MSKLEKIMNQDLSYNEDGKKAFHSEGKRVLKLLAEKMGLGKSDYDLRSSLGGIAVSGDVILHTDNVYVSLSQTGLSNHKFMYRTCNGRKDYSGHQNNWQGIDALSDEEIDGFAKKLLRLAVAKSK